MSAVQVIKCPILTYHSIDEEHSVISTGVKLFYTQMRFLSNHNFNVITLRTFEKYLSENKKIAANTVVLTFDDGFENFYTTVFPILEEFNFPATVFLITNYCGEFSRWPGNLQTLQPKKLMSWKQIRELSNNNVEFASHTQTHPDLTSISDNRIERELLESKLEIENQLSTEVSSLAYPYGKFSKRVKVIAERYFKVACSTNLGKVSPFDDFFSLKRIDVYYLQPKYIFRSVLSGKLEWYINLRQVGRDAKANWQIK